MADKQVENKRTKLSNVGTTKRKEILTEQEQNWQLKQHRANRWGKKVDQTAKPNQTSLALC